MGDSFQREIPKGRVNLSVDLQTNGAVKSIYLPHKVLVLGNFSGGKSKEPIQERHREWITRETRDHVMASYQPELNLCVNNKITLQDDSMLIKLQFSSLDDFHPESIVKQVPALNRLLAMRNLLKDLRSHLVDNTVLRTNLEALIADPQHMAELKDEINIKMSHKDE